MNNKPFAVARRALLAGLVLSVCCVPSEGREAIPSLRELARNSGLICFGTLSAVRNDRLRVSVDEVLKGTKPAADLDVPMPPINPFEGASPKCKEGDTVLLFVAVKEGRYELAIGPRSIIAITHDLKSVYREALKMLLEYELAISSPAKTKALSEMLRGNRLSKEAALNILYLEPGKDSAALLKDVLPLTQDSEARIAAPAVQVLGRIGTKTEVPVLADLMTSPNKHIRQTAHGILERLTGREIPMKLEDSEEKRKETVRKWKAWWEQNKETIKLRR